jgi:hypothetical protein
VGREDVAAVGLDEEAALVAVDDRFDHEWAVKPGGKHLHGGEI